MIASYSARTFPQAILVAFLYSSTSTPAIDSTSTYLLFHVSPQNHAYSNSFHSFFALASKIPHTPAILADALIPI
jgi:hypothetical protein